MSSRKIQGAFALRGIDFGIWHILYSVIDRVLQTPDFKILKRGVIDENRTVYIWNTGV